MRRDSCWLAKSQETAAERRNRRRLATASIMTAMSAAACVPLGAKVTMERQPPR